MPSGARGGTATFADLRPEQRLVLCEWGLTVALVVFFVWRGLVPGWGRLRTDFPNYYVAARLLRDGAPLTRAYDWVWFQRQADHLGAADGLVSFGPLTPFSALLLTPVAGLAPLAAKRFWLVVNVAFLGGTILVLRALSRLPLRRVALLTFLTVVPLRTCFAFGQAYVMLAFLVAAAAWLALRDRPFLSGAFVAVAMLLKIYPVLFVALFVLRKNARALVGVVVTTALSTAAFVWAFGVEPLRYYASVVLPRISAGEVHDPYYVAMSTPTVLLRHLLTREPELNPAPLFHATNAYVVLQPVVQALLTVAGLRFVVRLRADGAREPLLWGALGTLALIVSTGSSTYHFCLLILGTVVGVDALLTLGRPRSALALVFLHALVCAPFDRLVPADLSGWHALLGVPRLYGLLAYGGVYLSALRAAAPRAEAWEAPALGFLFAAMTAFGVKSNARHFAGLEATYADRVPSRDPGLITTAPTVAGDGDVLVSRTVDDAYAVGGAHGSPFGSTAPREDVFHPAVAGGTTWVEIATRTSRIARYPPGSTSEASATTVTDDGEDPAVSRDGRWLAFVRERRGRGTLWVVPAHQDGATPSPLTGDDQDVRDVSFAPDDRVAFASHDAVGFHLYVVAPGGGPPLALAIDGRYPAFSPDGKTLAFSRREGRSWQLAVRHMATGETHDVTHADCNAVSPAWDASGTNLLYATDCGRGLGAGALSRATIAEEAE